MEIPLRASEERADFRLADAGWVRSYRFGGRDRGLDSMMTEDPHRDDGGRDHVAD